MPAPLFDFIDEQGIPPYNHQRVIDFMASLTDGTDARPLEPDPELVEYLRIANGRQLRNCWFPDPDGGFRGVSRLFSYAWQVDLNEPIQDSWRTPGRDIRLDYSVPMLAGSMPNYPVGDLAVVPFAGINTEGMMEFDMLCLNYEFVPRPTVVLWEHAENAWEDCRTLKLIAKDFSEFKAMVVSLPPENSNQ